MHLAKIAGRYFSKNKAQILTGLGIIGVYATAYLSGKATLKASRIVEEQKLTSKKDILKETWMEYIPTGLVSALTSACIFGSGHIYRKKYAALMGLYTLSDVALREYKDRVKEQIGKNKAMQLDDARYSERIRSIAPSSDMIITGLGEVLCYDFPSGRYFKSDIEKIRRKENEFNQRLRTDMVLNLNELYFDLGLPQIKLGDDIGWDIEKDILTFIYSSQLTESGTPCLVIDYKTYPL